MKKKIQNRAILLMRILLSVVFVLGIGIIVNVSSAKADAPSQVKDSVVVVATVVKTDVGDILYSYGSGFFVGKSEEDPSYLVTNHHVVETYLEFKEGTSLNIPLDNGATLDKVILRVYFDQSSYVEAYVENYSEKADVAVLRIENPTTERVAVPVSEPTEEMVGNTAYAFGFPGIADNELKEAVSQWSKSDMTVTSGVISRLSTESGTGVRQIQTDTDFFHGNSGGPLVLENGVAIGMTSWAVQDIEGQEVRYAVSMAEVISLLNQASVEYDKGSDIEKDTSEDEAEVSATHDTEAVSGQTVKNESNSESDDDGGLSTTWLIVIIAGAAVLVAVIVILVIVIARKGKNKEIKLQPPTGHVVDSGSFGGQPDSPVLKVNLQVQGVSGIANGHTFTAGSDGMIKFGRNSTCQVVFSNQDSNISSYHCAVGYQKGGVVLMDNGSTNGTFLANGTRLQPGKPYKLNNGDKFYLVNKNYMFTVRI